MKKLTQSGICAVASLAGILLGFGYMVTVSGLPLVGIPLMAVGTGLTVTAFVSVSDL